VYRLIRPLLFSLPPEASHRLGLWALRLGAPLLPLPHSDARLGREILGMRFPNPVGLAAGFDKQAEAVGQWQKLGFGFCEIGTFTRHAQEGNPKPRIWRYPQASALINRLGFNNPGADEAARRLVALRQKGGWPGHPVGVNIGKSKITPEAEAGEDYLYSFEKLAPHADYVAVNVSSPNTPGLRNLQAARSIKKLVAALAASRRRSGWKRPIFVKFAPDLADRDLLASCDAALSGGAQGLILTNTTLGRDGLGPGQHPQGGLSGWPLAAMADRALQRVSRHTRGRVPIIGVGGILSAEDAARKLDLGASLVQLYTGLIYQGPGLPRKISRHLTKICG
jgi:dihydroorotate dehydrogenase